MVSLVGAAKLTPGPPGDPFASPTGSGPGRLQRPTWPVHGASRSRTDDLLGAIQALCQLSYSPAGSKDTEIRCAKRVSHAKCPTKPHKLYCKRQLLRRY